MKTVLISIIQLLLAVALLEAGSGLLGVLVPIRAQSEGFTTFAIGLFGSGYYLGFISGCVAVPALIRRVGYIRTFAGFVSVIAATVLLHPLIVWDTGWVVMRLIVGFGFAGVYIAVESWLNEIASNETRGRIFSSYMAATWLAVVVGKLLFGYWDPAAFEPFAVAVILVCLAVVPVAFTTMSAPQPMPQIPFEMRRVLKFSPLGVVGCVSVGATNGTFWSLGPLYPQVQGLSNSDIGIFMAVAVIGGAFTQWPLGKWSDRTDRRRVIAVTSCIASVAGLALALLRTGHETILMTVAVCYGAGALPLYGLLIAHTNDHAPNEAFVEVSSTLLLTFGVGAVLGPVTATMVMKLTGIYGIFLFTSVIHLLLFGYTLASIYRRAPVSEAEKTPFVVVEKTTPVAASLDPRAELDLANIDGRDSSSRI